MAERRKKKLLMFDVRVLVTALSSLADWIRWAVNLRSITSPLMKLLLGLMKWLAAPRPSPRDDKEQLNAQLVVVFVRNVSSGDEDRVLKEPLLVSEVLNEATADENNNRKQEEMG